MVCALLVLYAAVCVTGCGSRLPEDGSAGSADFSMVTDDSGAGSDTGGAASYTRAGAAPVWSSLTKTGSMERQYAEMFSVDYYGLPDEDGTAAGDSSAVEAQKEKAGVSSDDAQSEKAGGTADDAQAEKGGGSADGSAYALITMGPEEQEQSRCLVIPEGMPVPEGLDEDIVPVGLPLDHVYLAASSAMDFWRQLDALGAVSMTSTKDSDWSLTEVREAIRAGRMEYAGKYSAPDYERLLQSGCRLAIESTMIWHSPDTAEKLESLGIPVLVERSSYESHPLGRLEWIRLYGLLAGRQEEADAFFERKVRQLDGILSGSMEESGKTVAFFYITANGNANIRKPGDYVTKMISMAGGEYVFSGLTEEDGVQSTMNLQMEQFYQQGRDADILIYNSTIDGDLQDLDDLLGKSDLFAEFRAVKNGDVWCTGKNMFQETTCASDMILELNRIFAGDAGDGETLQYLHKVK